MRLCIVAFAIPRFITHCKRSSLLLQLKVERYINGYIKALEHNSVPKLPDPDFFQKPTSINRLKEIMPGYKKTLGAFLLLTSFSYFEAYVGNIFKEIFEFHKPLGGLLEIAI